MKVTKKSFYKLATHLFIIGVVFFSSANQVIATDPDPYVQRDDIRTILNIGEDSVSGSFSYNYPIDIPSGRNGLQPNLELSYNSQDNNNQNLFGYGWGMDIPYIERLNKKGIDKLYSDPYFNSSLTGELVETSVSDIYASKVENGEFFEYNYTTSTNTWVAKDKQGITYTFGPNNLSRQDDIDDSTKVFKWMLEEVRDTNDNFVRYEYYRDAGQIYPKRIIYSGNGDRDPYVEDLTDRHDLGIDNDTRVLYHMNGETGSSGKIDNAVGNNQFDLLELGNPTSVQGFNQRPHEAYFLNGIDQYLQASNNFYTIATNPATIEFWTKSDLNNNHQRLVSASSSYGNDSYLNISLNDEGKIYTWLHWYNNGYYNFQTTGDIVVADGEWHYVAVVLENNPKANVEIYIDGILDVSNNQGQSVYALSDFFYGWSLGVGRATSNDDTLIQFYRGAIDEFRVSNVARGAQEIADYYNNISPIDESNTWEENDGIFEIEFLRETRDDDSSFYEGNAHIVNNYRINEIQISVNNQLEKTYHLNYASGDNSTRSLLDNIVEEARDPDSGVMINMPEDSFDYNIPEKNWTLSGYSYPSNCSGVAGETVTVADFNGDALADFLCFISTGSNDEDDFAIYLNNGDGTWEEHINPNAPISLSETWLSKKFQLADFNGDGLVDFAASYTGYQGVYLNNGDLTWTKEMSYGNLMPNDIYYSIYIDVNNDGRADKIYAYANSIGGQWKEVFINNGSSFVSDSNYNIDFLVASFGPNAMPIDVNGDGFIDFMFQNDVHINNADGTGWYVDPNYQALELWHNFAGAGYVQVAKLMDINADGLTDVVRRDLYNLTNGIFINNGDGTWTEDNTYSIPVSLPGIYSYSDRYAVSDMNGDGFVDWVETMLGRTYLFDLNQGVDVINVIDTREGSQINIEYQSSIQTTSTNELLNPELPFVVQTIKQITIDDGLGNQSTRDYEYSDGQFYYNNPYDKKFAGFGQITKTDSDTKTISYYHQGNTSNSSQGEYNDSYYKIGKKYRQEVYDSVTDDLLTQEIYKWEEYDQLDGNRFVYNTQSANTSFDATIKSVVFQMQYDTSNGNLLAEDNLGEVTMNLGTGDVTNQLIGDEKDVDYLYAENTTKHILAAPKTKTISNTVDSKQQDIYYNEEAYGLVNRVNVTKEEYETNEAEINRKFNSYGLAYEQSDPKFATTTIVYDTYNMYPASSIDPLSNVTYTDYNLLNGQVATSTAPNGAMTVNKFDAFGRIVETKISNPDSPSTLIIKQEISYQDITLPRYKETKNYFDTSSYVTSREYYNGLDRVIQTKVQTATANEYTTVDISYDDKGRVNKQSLPYITTSMANSSADLTKPVKTYTYDGLGRVLTEITPVGTTSYQYDGFTTTIIDANNNRKDLTKDAYGNLVEVKEYNDANVYTTSYDYSLTNKLEKITDEQGNVRNFHYDALDNLDWQDMVHKSSVSTPEKIDYTHDKNGNVLTETSFKNDAISYTYDGLNRVEYEKLSGVNQISYTYDQNGDIGQLSFVDYGNNNNKAYDYDILGNLKTTTTTIENENFIMSFDYNLNGDIKEIIYPNDWVVTYGFNSIGQIDEVSLDRGAGANILVENIEYNQNGQMTHLERSNGVDTDYLYDALKNFRLTHTTSTWDTTILQNISYTYDAIGNITDTIDDSDTDLAKYVDYDYDDLYRLAISTVAYTTHSEDDYTRTYGYDEVGNMTYNSILGIMTYNNDNPHQLSGYSTRTFVYDDAGNQKYNGGFDKFFWDHRSRLESTYDITSEDSTYYKYDHNNQRFLKYTNSLVFIPPDIHFEETPIEAAMGFITMAVGGGTWELRRVKEDKYIDSYFEQDLNNNTKTHLFLNSSKIATINNNASPYFILTDHLDSSSLLIDISGNIKEQKDYYPYGDSSYENITTDMSSDYGFTGQEYDEETDVQYFGARYYDNEIGNFLSLEPVMIVLHDGNQLKSISGKQLQNILSDPQALNSYSYSRNNPVILVDADGNWWKAFFTGQQSWGSFQTELGQAAQQLYNDSGTAKTIMDNPVKSSLAIGVGSGLAAYGASAAITSGLTQLGILGTQADKAVDFTQKYGQQWGGKMNEVQKLFQKEGLKFDPHLAQRTVERSNRGVTPDNVLDTIRTGSKYFDKMKGNYSYFKEGIRVAQELDGTFKTVVTQGSMNADRFTKLID